MIYLELDDVGCFFSSFFWNFFWDVKDVQTMYFLEIVSRSFFEGNMRMYYGIAWGLSVSLHMKGMT